MLCYTEMNRNEEALTFINDYLDNYPFSETAWYEYGIFHFNKKNYQEAIKGFDYLLAINLILWLFIQIKPHAMRL